MTDSLNQSNNVLLFAEDTIVSSGDALQVTDQSNLQLSELADKIVVNTISEPNSVVEEIGLWVGIILGIITIAYTLYSTYKLRKNDEDTQRQLSELRGIVGAIEAQNGIITDGNSVMRDYIGELQNLLSTGRGSKELASIEEKRFRLSVKPRLYINGSGYQGFDGQIHFRLDNRGELCYYDGYEFLEGDSVRLNTWSKAVTIPKDGNIKITGETEIVHPKDARFKIKIFYHDQEKYKYESIVEWTGHAKLTETIEL